MLYDLIIGAPAGGTTHLIMPDAIQPKHGYFVGGHGPCLVLPSMEHLTRELADSFASHIRTDWVGWWTDSETGKIYLDAVQWYPFRVDAEREARYAGEIAFYDVANDSDVRLA
jgi:hypothetical protein